MPTTPAACSDPAAPTTPIETRKSKIANPRRLAANRANAARSTGPRTDAGKRRSSQNAVKHGLTANGILTTPLASATDLAAPTTSIENRKSKIENPLPLPPDLSKDPDFEVRRLELARELRPSTPAQHFLLDQLALIAWRLDQFPEIERRILATPLQESEPACLPDHGQPMRYRTGSDGALVKPDDPTPTLIARHLLQDGPTPLTRLWDLQRRLIARFQSILRLIPRLKQLDTRYHNAEMEDLRRQTEQAATLRAQARERDAANIRAEQLQDELDRLTSQLPTPADSPAHNEPAAPPPATADPRPASIPIENRRSEIENCSAIPPASINSDRKSKIENRKFLQLGSDSPAHNEPTAHNEPGRT